MEAEHAMSMEERLECSLCGDTFLQTTNVAECSHRFCLECIKEALEKTPACPKCQKPVDIKNLTADPRLDAVVSYLNMLKTELLSHPLTPLTLSLRQQQQQKQMNKHPQTASNSDNTAEESVQETAEEDQLEETSSDAGGVIPSLEEFQKSFSQKRKHNDTDIEIADTQTTVNEEDDLEGEFNDSLPDSATQGAKRFKPSESGPEDEAMAGQQPKITDDDEKKRLLNPQNMLGGMWSLPQDATQSQSQRNDSSAMTSVSGNSDSEAAQEAQRSPTKDHTLADEPMSQSTQSAAIKEASKDFVPDTVYSDNEDAMDTSTCACCRFYRNHNANGMISSAEASQEPAAVTDTVAPPVAATAAAAAPKEPYKMTVAGDEAPIEGTFTVPKTRRRTSSTSRKEVHIIYTGLTPEDEKKLDKIKEEADLTLKIVIHYQMRDFADVTHVITSVDKKHLCKRTLKYLQGVLKGKWIVDPQWVIDSTKSKKWQAEDKYEVQGDHLTGKTHAPKLGRESHQEPLFQDLKFYLFGDFTGKHNKNDLLILCKAGGAKILSRKPPGHVARNKQALNTKEPIVIYSEDQQKKKKKPVWLNQVQVRDPQWIIDCISKFKVE
ncbi:hypothetical protein MBANPS3_004647 [Mucor bainieri]